MSQFPLEFSGIVVVYNEEKRLGDCLRSLAFCDELLIVDLGSTDGSLDIARELGSRVIHHARVEVVEEVWGEIVPWARHEWIILLDPDEVFPSGVDMRLRALIQETPNLGAIRLPWQFYFKGKPLYVTIWGQPKFKPVVLHRERNTFPKHVHRGVQLCPGCTEVILDLEPGQHIQHFWVDSYRQLWEKHWRYLKREGESRYSMGERFGRRKWIRQTWEALYQNLVDYGGLRGGFTGIFLSLFYSWYVSMSLLSLWRYQRRAARVRDTGTQV